MTRGMIKTIILKMKNLTTMMMMIR